MLQNHIGGELLGSDAEFSSVSTDTRNLRRGSAYLALLGENFDGNDFVEAAAANGANAAIVGREHIVDIPTLKVADTHRALGELAALNRRRGSAKVIALTGSQGKTTVKEMLGKIFATSGETLITDANLNNTIGVPLTLLKLNEGHQFAVIEMGANVAGEVAFSAGITQPDVALINNASAAHIEGFGSLEGIVKAKGEIIEGLPAHGTLILNGDDENVDHWIRRADSRRVILFSLENSSGNSQYFAKDIELSVSSQVSFVLVSPQGECKASINLLGKHNVMNAIAAAAVAMETGVELDLVPKGLAALMPINGRMNPLPGINTCHLIDDSYNASPKSFAAAIDVLMSFPGRKILVAGEMKELGKEAVPSHRQVGNYAANAGVQELWTVGEMTKHTAAAFGAQARHFDEMKALIEECVSQANSDVTFLIKGSRGARMDVLVDELRADGEI